MAQEFHNWLTIAGPYRARLDFIADALSTCPWHWYKVDVDAQAPVGGLAVVSLLNFYTRGSPKGLGNLQARHPDMVVKAVYFDLSAPAIYREVWKGRTLHYYHEGDVDHDLKEAARETNEAALESAFRDVCAGLLPDPATGQD